jgi:hypothetical protein
VPYNSSPRHGSLFGEAETREEKNMKHVIRIAVLMLGLVGTYVAAAVPQVPTPDGGPILTCQHSRCGLPPM